MEIKLRRCPFCFSDVACLSNAKELEDCKHFEDEDKCPAMKWEEECKSVCVVCDVSKGGCGASSGYATSKEKAIRKWNMRFSEIEPLAKEREDEPLSEEREDQEIEKNPVVQAIDNAIAMRF